MVSRALSGPTGVETLAAWAGCTLESGLDGQLVRRSVVPLGPFSSSLYPQSEEVYAVVHQGSCVTSHQPGMAQGEKAALGSARVFSALMLGFFQVHQCCQMRVVGHTRGSTRCH